MENKKASFSFASIVAIVAAICSLNLAVFFGQNLIGIEIICGLLGIFFALRPNVRGSGLSIVAIRLSVIGVIAAVIKAIIWVFSN